MAQLWYYVNDGDRVGPVAQKEIVELIKEAKLDLQSYVWRKGFADWMHIEDVSELTAAVETEDISEEEIATDDVFDDFKEDINEPLEEIKEEVDIVGEIEVEEEIEEPVEEAIDLAMEEELSIDVEYTPSEEIEIDENQELEMVEEFEPLFFSNFDLKIDKFFIRTGNDRGSSETEYGPFSFAQLKALLDQKRISDMTLIFSIHMPHWAPLGSFVDFEKEFLIKSTVDNNEKRKFIRKPFVARMLYANKKEVFEGICRDLSVGGMQVLMDHFPGLSGEQISLNVHPENSEHHFVADGKVVRVLEGKKGFSFRFINLSDEAKDSIERYIVSEEN